MSEWLAMWLCEWVFIYMHEHTSGCGVWGYCELLNATCIAIANHTALLSYLTSSYTSFKFLLAILVSIQWCMMHIYYKAMYV